MTFTLLCSLVLSAPLHADEGDWTPGGEPVCTVFGLQDSPSVVSDGQGGTFIAWADARYTTSDLYVQRVGPDGVVIWALDGIQVESNILDPPGWTKIQLISDGGTGAIIVFKSWSRTLLAQKVDADGNFLWTGEFSWQALDIFWEGGNMNSGCTDFNAISDGAGGVVVTWSWFWREAFLEPVYERVSVQRVDTDGVLQWGDTFPPRWGVVLEWNNGTASNPKVMLDGSGGAIVSWHTDPSGAVPPSAVGEGGSR